MLKDEGSAAVNGDSLEVEEGCGRSVLLEHLAGNDAGDHVFEEELDDNDSQLDNFQVGGQQVRGDFNDSDHELEVDADGFGSEDGAVETVDNSLRAEMENQLKQCKREARKQRRQATRNSERSRICMQQKNLFKNLRNNHQSCVAYNQAKSLHRQALCDMYKRRGKNYRKLVRWAEKRASSNLRKARMLEKTVNLALRRARDFDSRGMQIDADRCRADAKRHKDRSDDYKQRAKVWEIRVKTFGNALLYYNFRIEMCENSLSELKNRARKNQEWADSNHEQYRRFLKRQRTFSKWSCLNMKMADEFERTCDFIQTFLL